MIYKLLLMAIFCGGQILTAGNNLPPKQMEKFCFSCHDEDVQKGNLRLDNLDSLKLEARLDIMNRVQEQVYLGQMPPKKKKQPGTEDKKLLLSWLSSELKKHNASKLEDKMRFPNYGNYVDHEMLFSGKIKEKAFTPARRWLVTPQIFQQRVFEVFNLNERQRTGKSFGIGITKPLVLTDESGIRSYDNSVLGGGHLRAMLKNAEWISNKQIFAASYDKKDFKKIKHENPKDSWFPSNIPIEFVNIIKKKTAPSDNELIDAIKKQFELVLKRHPDDEELNVYIKFTKEVIAEADQYEGLRQMLKAVLVDSDFLYRTEFGSGTTDQYGRKKMAPLEAAIAISYALGDRGPDEHLMAAAKTGKLLSKEDYKREVERLLNDQEYYFDQVDPELGGNNPQFTSHPKINRFFREFFGYDTAFKIFKDQIRSGGYYRNFRRKTTGTGGALVRECDMFVDRILKKDKDVFKELLTSDLFYAAPLEGNDEGKAEEYIALYQKMYDQLKDTNWRKEKPSELVKKIEFRDEKIKEYVLTRYSKNKRNKLKEVMRTLESFHKKGIKPHPKTDSKMAQHVYSYNIDPLNEEYVSKQPYKMPNRKGILTHPAWLISHSHNTETDPVVRGKWIREKLLAGRVPDVPVTVDAKVPLDPHKTLRERFDDVTGKAECWKCHVYMNPLGYPFESFDDFGRYREEEKLEHKDNIIKTITEEGKVVGYHYKTKKVDSTGELTGTGNPKLDGEVNNAFELIDRLAQSSRVRQSIIRHAFRYFMGRNEMLSDSQTLIDADNAYVKSGGSFNAVIVSLLASDSFMYRKDIKK